MQEKPTTLSETRRLDPRRSRLLIFSSSTCSTCRYEALRACARGIRIKKRAVVTVDRNKSKKSSFLIFRSFLKYWSDLTVALCSLRPPNVSKTLGNTLGQFSDLRF